jgi:hypothetical protein
MGDMGMIMDEKNLKLWDEKVINHKYSCSIVAKIVKGAK